MAPSPLFPAMTDQSPHHSPAPIPSPSFKHYTHRRLLCLRLSARAAEDGIAYRSVDTPPPSCPWPLHGLEVRSETSDWALPGATPLRRVSNARAQADGGRNAKQRAPWAEKSASARHSLSTSVLIAQSTSTTVSHSSSCVLSPSTSVTLSRSTSTSSVTWSTTSTTDASDGDDDDDSDEDEPSASGDWLAHLFTPTSTHRTSAVTSTSSSPPPLSSATDSDSDSEAAEDTDTDSATTCSRSDAPADSDSAAAEDTDTASDADSVDDPDSDADTVGNTDTDTDTDTDSDGMSERSAAPAASNAIANATDEKAGGDMLAHGARPAGVDPLLGDVDTGVDAVDAWVDALDAWLDAILDTLPTHRARRPWRGLLTMTERGGGG